MQFEASWQLSPIWAYAHRCLASAVLTSFSACSSSIWFCEPPDNQLLINPSLIRSIPLNAVDKLTTQFSANIGERKSKGHSTPFKPSFSFEKWVTPAQFLHLLKKRSAAARDTCGYMCRPLQRKSQYYIGFICTFWKPLLRHFWTQFQSVALSSNRRSAHIPFLQQLQCNSAWYGNCKLKTDARPKQKVIHVALVAAGTALFKSTRLKDKQCAALTRPGGEGEGRGKLSPQFYRIREILQDYGCWRIYTPHDP